MYVVWRLTGVLELHVRQNRIKRATRSKDRARQRVSNLKGRSAHVFHVAGRRQRRIVAGAAPARRDVDGNGGAVKLMAAVVWAEHVVLASFVSSPGGQLNSSSIARFKTRGGKQVHWDLLAARLLKSHCELVPSRPQPSLLFYRGTKQSSPLAASAAPTHRA
ncbi:hypothetical protein CIHG_01536 [Coccidioides immitis H538.4]|uniref:Uncharacterized protein n=2 Tax=Coccidioides immitis TaxID=5501 RepID=A0A0J8RIE7_COCIT|nr:hypothetical protein CIRG_01387 [Coccidioides immitis RMSCC 2394]KMU83754.1 hypothetical protein CIHG_01536 [Coccidioides immitis H538.4]